MSSLFRSEEMTLCQLFLQSEAAYACVAELGELGQVQFKDLNVDMNSFQKKFVAEVRRCDDMERKLKYIEKEMKRDDIEMPEIGDDPKAPQPKEMIALETTFDKLDTELKDINRNAEALKKNYQELIELKHILKRTQVFFDEKDEGFTPAESMTKALIGEESNKNMPAVVDPIQLGFVTGVVLRERIPAFERMLWRACRGNAFFRQAEIETPLEDPVTGNEVSKSVFVIFFQGEQLKTKVKKICEGFRSTLYPCPEVPGERREMAMGVMTRIADLNTVLSQTEDHRRRVLVAAAKSIKHWFIQVRKIKAIYHTLNMFNFDVTQKCLIAECWIPSLDIPIVYNALYSGSAACGSTVPPIINKVHTMETPPTYNRTNKFTRGFQNLVDAYGVGSYREMNPAPYTIITFPFLFSVMFGDIGHGLIVALFGAWMVIREKALIAQKSTNEVWNIFFGGRYIILLMGCFSVYTGFIYNDLFSKSINLFHSSWSTNYNQSTIETNNDLTLDPATDDYTGTPYPFGMDPVWQFADNKITFLNTYKMKISIIFGVIHMLFGVCISVVNYIHYRSKLDIFTMFIPQVIFLCCLFLYLVILMFIKWVMYSAKSDDVNMSPYCAPSVLITFIHMVLVSPNEGAPLDNDKKCPAYIYNNEDLVQKILLVLAIVCIPWMLIIKPVVIQMKRKKTTLPPTNHVGEGRHHEEEEEAMSEIYIHQGIHTIEYVLGSVSHTASYLRLWALSLAHAQLSEVLWSMVFQKGLKIGGGMSNGLGGIVIFVVFVFWAMLTLSILVLMEGLSAFLHTLRLHWVEFQSKFYEGRGYQFAPFSFKTILELARLAED